MSEQTEIATLNIYNTIKINITEHQINIATLMSLLPQLMEAAGKYKNLDGPSKKKVVIGVVDHIIANHVEDPTLATSLQHLVPTACDVLYDCWQNKYIFAQKFQGCFAKCKKH